MGCDIHLFAEAKTDDGTWEAVFAPPRKCWRCNGTGIRSGQRDSEPCYACNMPFHVKTDWETNQQIQVPNLWYCGEPGMALDHWYDERNYYVFACLADVRNHEFVMAPSGYWGFAEPRFYEPIIDESRGIPEGCVDPAFSYLNDDMDIHSVSWLSLEEIFAYEWPTHGRDTDGTMVQLEHNRAEYFMTVIKALAITAGDRPTRIVFGFDN